MGLFGRFAEKFERGGPDECWEWRGNMNRGYGMLRVRGDKEYAHRLMWELHNGELPDGMMVLHACDNSSCVNPAHLEAGDMQDNMDDRAERDRTARGIDAGHAKLTDVEGLEIHRRYNKPGVDVTMQDLADEYDTTPATVSRIANRQQRWTWIDP